MHQVLFAFLLFAIILGVVIFLYKMQHSWHFVYATCDYQVYIFIVCLLESAHIRLQTVHKNRQLPADCTMQYCIFVKKRDAGRVQALLAQEAILHP